MKEFKPGERVRSSEYGEGLIAVSNALMIGIFWDDPRYEGRRFLHHEPSFARTLELVPPVDEDEPAAADPGTL